MSRIAIAIVVFTASAIAQNAEPANSSDAVLHIRGLCANGCDVDVSRPEFEAVMRIVAPDREATRSLKESVSKAYAELLAFDRAAREAEIQNSQEYRDTMQWLDLKTRAKLLRQRLEKESEMVTA